VLDPPRLTTERLEMRPFDRRRDWSAFVRHLVLDPVVTAGWPDFADPSLTDADKERIAAGEFLPWFEEGQTRGLIVWTLRTLDGAFVGVSGLLISDPPVGGSDPEFGCMLGARWHGQGLATEAGRAVIEDGWSRLGLTRIITVLDSANPASRRLVDKLGFSFDQVVFDEAQRPFIWFVIERPASSIAEAGSVGA
jgi:RimJ/RimL family protein N-acetyltransferase